MDPHGFTVIVQRSNSRGDKIACHGGGGIPLAVPARFVVLGDPPASSWRDELAQRILGSFLPGPAAQADTCGGPGWLGCWATTDPLVSQLLVVVASTQPPTSDLEDATAEWLARGLEAVGVVRSADNPDQVLPRGLQRQHALRWSANVGEVLQDLLDVALLGGEARRVFISYAHRDGESHASQAQRELAARRFEIFLDRFVLPPGADFVDRIEDELRDKAVVLVIETAAALRSAWVQREVTTAINRALTVLAYNPDGTAGFAEIAEADRCRSLASLGVHVEARHRDGLVARRRSLHESLRQALLDAGVADAEIAWTGLGCRVRSTHEIAVSLRPADLRRVRLLSERAAGIRPVLIHPWPFSAARRRDLAWLRSISGVADVDEGRLVEAAARIAAGTL